MSDFPISYQQFKELFPRAKKPSALYKEMTRLLDLYDIDTPYRIAAFLAQCGHESAGFRYTEENLNYSANALNRVFAKYFKGAGRSASKYARNPRAIASIVYANRMGNGDISSGDGWTYRGRGYIQLTGKYNYTQFASDMEMSLPETINYLETIEGALESACWYWYKHNLNSYADRQDIRGMTKRINGGYNGLEEREHMWNKILRLMETEAPDSSTSAPSTEPVNYNVNITLSIGDRGEDVSIMQRALGLSGDGIFGPNTKRAVKAFQRQNGLVADGIAGQKTLSKLYGVE